MLIGLSIRDIVLIDHLRLDLQAGLNVMTGETGAGKSILLNALGLALGVRADKSLVRQGANIASVSAEFVVSATHPAYQILRDQDLPSDDTLVLRRTLSSEGVSRGFVNDQVVTAGLLRQIGATLIEIQGQGEQYSLSSVSRHRELLDAYASLGPKLDAVGTTYDHMRRAAAELEDAIAINESEEEEEQFVLHSFNEIESLEPREGEEMELAEQRALLMHGGRIIEAVRDVATQMGGDVGISERLHRAIRTLRQVQGDVQGRLEGALSALDRAVIETEEVEVEINNLILDVENKPERLEQIEQRLFALRAVARKHKVEVDDLPSLKISLGKRLVSLEDGIDRLAALREKAERSSEAYCEQALVVSASRKRAAKSFDRAIMDEFVPLKLDKAIFRTDVYVPEGGGRARYGIDHVEFNIATVPNAAPGPISRVASGGELARFLLALKVVLAGRVSMPSLVFDEVDQGIGGATADAVGERLLKLAEGAQVIVITHSPQVAARGTHHWRINKQSVEHSSLARLEYLEGESRREEIARMLSGSSITEEAREAAMSLIRGADVVAETVISP